MKFSIIPGAIQSVRAFAHVKKDGERKASYWRKESLPLRGGVGTMPLPIVHQGNMPICTGIAAANARMILEYQRTGVIVPFSGLFIYKMNRLFDGLAREEKGSTLNASMQTLYYKGVCTEKLYPSNEKHCARPFPKNGKYLVQQAEKYRVKNYIACNSLSEILVALSQNHPVVFSMIIYTDFYHAKKGIVPKERRGERIGGHSMVAMNYDLELQYLQVLQSWGTSTKGPTDGGYMYIPFSWFSFQDSKSGQDLLFEAFALFQ